MNAKKAKALRKMMRNWSGMSQENHELPGRQLLEDTNKATIVIVTKEELEAAGVNPVDYEVNNRGTVTSAPTTPTQLLSGDGTVEPVEPKSVYSLKIKDGPIRNWSGMPQKNHELPGRQLLEDTNKAQLLSGDGTVEPVEPKSVYKVKIKGGPMRNNPQSKRGMYLHFKGELEKLEDHRARSRNS